MPTVLDILSHKGSHVASIPSSATVLEATHVMNERRIGALVVKEGEEVVGIFTERDVLRRVVAVERAPAATLVKDVMTADVVCCEPESDLEEASRIMRDKRIRHLPVCCEKRGLVGLVSIGDLNAYYASTQEAEILFLHDYVYGRA
jgi:CBS domain-containing protein